MALAGLPDECDVATSVHFGMLCYPSRMNRNIVGNLGNGDCPGLDSKNGCVSELHDSVD